MSRQNQDKSVSESPLDTETSAAPTSRQKRGARRIFISLSWLLQPFEWVLLVAVGILIGTVFVTSDEIIAASPELLRWAVFGMSAGGVGFLILLIGRSLFRSKMTRMTRALADQLKWLFQPQVSDETWKRAVDATRDRLCDQDVSDDKIKLAAYDEYKKHINIAIVAKATDVIEAYLMSVAYWRTLAALGGVIGAAVLAAQFVMFVQQTERLGEQNDLIKLQAQMEVVVNRAEIGYREAEMGYNRIREGLQSESPIARLNAIEELVDVMLLDVEVIDPNWRSGVKRGMAKSSQAEFDAYFESTDLLAVPEVKTVIDYPNLTRLYGELIRFASKPRAVADDGVAEESTAICESIHRLGGRGGDPKAPNLWNTLMEAETGRFAPGTIKLGLVNRARKRINRREERIDLRHLSTTKALPLYLARANLENAQLDEVQFVDVNFDGAKLSKASLVLSVWKSSSLRGVDMGDAQIVGTSFGRHVDLSFSSLRNSTCFGTVFDGSKLQGVDLGGAKVIGSMIVSRNIRGVRFAETTLHATTFFLPTPVGEENYGKWYATLAWDPEIANDKSIKINDQLHKMILDVTQASASYETEYKPDFLPELEIAWDRQNWNDGMREYFVGGPGWVMNPAAINDPIQNEGVLSNNIRENLRWISEYLSDGRLSGWWISKDAAEKHLNNQDYMWPFKYSVWGRIWQPRVLRECENLGLTSSARFDGGWVSSDEIQALNAVYFWGLGVQNHSFTEYARLGNSALIPIAVHANHHYSLSVIQELEQGLHANLPEPIASYLYGLYSQAKLMTGE